MKKTESKKDWESVLKKRCDHYASLTKKALVKAKIAVPQDGSLYPIAVDFKEMAQNYLQDGHHFMNGGQFELALAAFSYAHAWLDAGARLGLFDVKGDHQLFTLFK